MSTTELLDEIRHLEDKVEDQATELTTLRNTLTWLVEKEAEIRLSENGIILFEGNHDGTLYEGPPNWETLVAAVVVSPLQRENARLTKIVGTGLPANGEGMHPGDPDWELARLHELSAKNDHYRRALADAPHGNHCPSQNCAHRWESDHTFCGRGAFSHDTLVHNFKPRGECNCWKAQALETTPLREVT